MNPAKDSFFPLAEFLVFLRNEDFPVGVDTYMQVQKVLNYLPPQMDREQLHQVLCPIFARSEAEQKRFYRLYEGYFAKRENDLFTAVQGNFEEEAQETKIVQLDWSWLRKYSRPTFIILTLLISATFIYLPLRVYWAIKGTDKLESAPAYLERYGFADSERYNFEITKYVIRNLLVIDQPCEDLENASFSYQLIQPETIGDSTTYPVGFESTIMVDDGWPSLQWTFPNNQGLSEVSAPVYNFADTGSYEVMLAFRNAYGCETAVKRSVMVTPGLVCEARFSYTIAADDPLLVQFSDTSLTEVQDAVVKRLWTVTDLDSMRETGVSPQMRFPSYDNYQVCLRIETEGGCVNTICKALTLEDTRKQTTVIPVSPKRFVPVPRPAPSSPYLLFMLLGGAILILVGGFFHDVYRRMKRRAALQKERNAEGPFYHDLVLDFEDPIYPAEQIFNAARKLRERQERPTEDLDLPRTITATLEGGGFPDFRYLVGSRASEYLVLIERRSRRDHWAALQDELLRAISQLDVFIDRYYYDQEFANFYQKKDAKPISLAELKQRHPDHRLIVMGDGEGLTDVLTGDLSPELIDLLSWEDRGLLTSASPQDWSLQEVGLAKFFKVLPATLDSLTRLTELWSDQRTYRLKRVQDALLVPVPDHVEAEEVQILKSFLGPSGFRWLAACALYPELHWDLTRYLGEILANQYPDGAYLEEATWLRLVRLPYFRTGTLSDALRLKLAATLSPTEKREIRQAIVDVLEENRPTHACYARDQHEIRLKTQKWEAGTEEGQTRRDLGEEVSGMLVREEIDDVVVLDEMGQIKAGNLQLSWSEGMRNIIFDKGMPILGVKSWLRLSLAIILALVMLIPLIQRTRTASQSGGFLNWIKRSGNLVSIDGNFVRLTNSKDSALYASYLGEELFFQKDYGSAYNRFSQAIKLAPTEAVFYYQRGLAGLYLSRIRHVEEEMEQTYADFARAQNLVPTLTSQSQILPDPVTSKQGSEMIQQSDLSEDGSWVLTASSRQVRIQELPSSASIAFWNFPKGGVRFASLAPNKEFVAVVQENTVIVLDVRSGKELYRLEEHKLPINVCRFSHDGTKLLTAGQDNLTLIWDRATGALIQTLEFIHTDPILDANFSPDDQSVLTASADSTVGIWSVSEGEFLQELLGHNAPVNTAKFMGRGKWIFTSSTDGTVILWNQYYQPLVSYKIPAQFLHQVELSEDGSVAAISYEREESAEVIFELISTASGNSIRKIPVQGLLALQKESREERAPALQLAKDLSIALISLPDEGWEARRLQPELNVNSLKPYSIFNAGLIQYESNKFKWAVRSLNRYLTMRPDDAQAYLARGLTYLYQIPNESSPISRTRLSQLALGDLAQALATDSTGEAKLTRILPVLLDQYNQFAELRNIKSDYCRVLDLFEEGNCDQLLNRYSEILPFAEGRAPVMRDSLWGYIDTAGAEVIPIQYIQATSFKQGLAQVRPPSSASFQFIDPDGTLIFSASLPESEGLIPVKSAEDNTWGFLSAKDNRLIIQPEFEEVWGYARGYAKVKRAGEYYLIDNRGHDVFGPFLRLDGSFAQDSVLMGYKQDASMERIPYMSPEARQLARNKEQRAQDTVKVSRDTISVKIGDTRKPTTGDDEQVILVGNTSQDLILARKGNLYGYVEDQSHDSYMQKTPTQSNRYEVVIEFQYADGQDFRQNRAGVKISNGNWGFIDTYGKAVTAFVYESVQAFQKTQQGARALVHADGRDMYIDPYGQCIPVAGYPCPMTKSQPSPPVPSKGGPQDVDSETGLISFKRNGKFGLKNNQGQIVIPAKYENRISFKGGLAAVNEYGKWGFIDPSGKVIVQPVYDDVQEFSDGLAAVKQQGLWGYINKKGEFIVEPAFSEANPFHQGKAVVRRGKLSYRINRLGQRIGDRRK